MKRNTILAATLVGALMLVAGVWVFKNQRDEPNRDAGNQVRDGGDHAANGKARASDKNDAADLTAKNGESTTAPADEAADENDRTVPQTETAERDSAAGGKRTHPQDLVTGLFRLGQKATKAVDDLGQELLALDLEDELRLGDEAHQELTQDKVVNAPDQLQRVERLAQPFLNVRQRKEVPYTFIIRDDPVVNAFSHLGGYVYLNQGLLDFVADDNELQFVIGHEIAHVDLKHCVRQFTYVRRASELGTQIAGRMTQLAYQAVALGYSEDQEFEADEYAFRRLLKIGRTRDDALKLPRHFLEHFGDEDELDRPKDILAAVEAGINNHFASHPTSGERVRRLEAIKIDGKQK